MVAPAKQTILIVEDEGSIADTLIFSLKTEGFEAVWAQTAADAVQILRTVTPHLIVLDVGLPDRSGFDLCKDIRSESSVPILFVTARAEEVDRILGLELGGDDYVTKPFSPREVAARIKAILRRGAPQPPAKSAPPAGFAIDQDRMKIVFRGIPLDLSRYEFRLLAILVKRPGRVFSREQLMSIAWESPEMSLERTVDTHIKTIRAKLKAIAPDEDPIITHRGFGYSLKEEA